MREFRSYGSVRGAVGNNRPYREHRVALETVSSTPISCRTPTGRKGPCVTSTASPNGGAQLYER
jgi:hypothetical protein